MELRALPLPEEEVREERKSSQPPAMLGGEPRRGEPCQGKPRQGCWLQKAQRHLKIINHDFSFLIEVTCLMYSQDISSSPKFHKLPKISAYPPNL